MESVAATAWLGLARERERLESFDMRAAALSDPARSTRYRLQAAGLTLDYSRNRVDDAALDALFALARACCTGPRLREQFGGAPVNRMFADEIGADGYGPDAPSSVEMFQRFMAAQ
jgi:glucose-6-phosphate isomerase